MITLIGDSKSNQAVLQLSSCFHNASRNISMGYILRLRLVGMKTKSSS